MEFFSFKVVKKNAEKIRINNLRKKDQKLPTKFLGHPDWRGHEVIIVLNMEFLAYINPT